jgi:glycosyltransferase involved in cell wall biosynthesis
MPAFNVERYVESAVMSVVDQSFDNLELIFIDDGSTDSTLAIVEGDCM